MYFGPTVLYQYISNVVSQILQNIFMLPFGVIVYKIQMQINKKETQKLEGQEDLQIELSCPKLEGYQPQVFLGKGSYGSVYLGVDKAGIQWAIKKVAKGSEPQIHDEFSIFKKFKSHPNILKPKNVIFPQDCQFYYMLFQPMQCDLNEYYNNTVYTPHERRILIVQLLKALQHLHGRSIVHNDIKPDNVLVEEIFPLHLRLGDFSLAKGIGYTTAYQNPLFGEDILQVAYMAWYLGAKKAKHHIHGLRAEKLAEDEDLMKEISQTQCKYIRQFFMRTLGAKNHLKIPRVETLLKIFPNQFLQGTDDVKYISPPKIKQLRSEKPIIFAPVQDQIQIEEMPDEQNKDKMGSMDKIRMQYAQKLRKIDGKLADSYLERVQKRKEDERRLLKKINIAYKAQRKRKLNIKRKVATFYCWRCESRRSLANKARHISSCKKKYQKKERKRDQAILNKIKRRREVEAYEKKTEKANKKIAKMKK